LRDFRDARGGHAYEWTDPLELRAALLQFIADFSNWDNAADALFLRTARALVADAHEALGGERGSRPLVVDPFAGGGTIPLEALRVGADTFASDLNPVPVLLNKVILEYVPTHGKILVEQFRAWGDAVLERVQKTLSPLYPRDASGGIPIAYLWARTIKCEGPSCGSEIPLLRATQLSRRKPGTHVRVTTRGKEINVTLTSGIEKKSTATVSGGKATCPRCGYTTPAKRVRAQMTEVSGGANAARLFAVLVEHGGGRKFRVPNEVDSKAVQASKKLFAKLDRTRPGVFPTEPVNPIRPYASTRGISGITRFGMERFIDLYTARQACAIVTFQDAIHEVRDEQESDSDALADAVETLLHLALDRLVMQNTSLSRWNNTGDKIEGLFSKQALQILWDFAESNPTSDVMASWHAALRWVEKVLEANACLKNGGRVELAAAEDCPLPTDSAEVIFTDPPYFAAIPYSDLSDVFYVWLRRGLRGRDAFNFSNVLAEKGRELIVTNSALGPAGEVKDNEFFAAGMTRSLTRAREIVKDDGIACIVFADSSTDAWEAMLRAVIAAGWVVTASWPMDTEMQERTRAHASASLQSSIFMVCRPREHGATTTAEDMVGDWRDVLSQLPGRIHQWMPRLAKEGIVGADAIFACIGPALEIFSRYRSVEKANGDVVSLAEYLEHVWSAVETEALSTIFDGADAAGLEPDARLTAMWLWTIGAGRSAMPANVDLPEVEEDTDGDGEGRSESSRGGTKGYAVDFDAARKIAQGLGVHLEMLSSIVEIAGDTARLVSVQERTAHLFGGVEGATRTASRGARKRSAQTALFTEAELAGPAAAESSPTAEFAVGSTVLDRVHQAMLLFSAGRADALKRFLVQDGAGQDERFWRLAQALSALYPAGGDEKRSVDGLLARKRSLGL
jgi:adenine-specific DNA methylase